MLDARPQLAEAEWLAKRGGNAKAAAARGLAMLRKGQGPDVESVGARLRALVDG